MPRKLPDLLDRLSPDDPHYEEAKMSSMSYGSTDVICETAVDGRGSDLFSVRLRCRQGHQMEPKLLHRPNSREILIDVVRLHDVEADLLIVSTIHILFAVAAANHDYRDALEALILFHGLQNI